MRLPLVEGEIERRLLVNYRVDPEAVSVVLPAPFRPQLVGGVAVAGICLIRLGGMRLKGMPSWAGVRSENAAHRIAVEWDGPDGPLTGVYIPRRDSNSLINRAVGGRMYPGEHHRAAFRVQETPTELHVAFEARDGSAAVDVRVRVADELAGSEVFPTLAAASAFFEQGSIGYSATRETGRFDGLQLQTSAWKVEPVTVLAARSSFFTDANVFPPGTAVLDSALLMRHVPVIWAALSDLRAQPAGFG